MEGFIAALLFGGFALPTSAVDGSTAFMPQVGAIRWDAWYGGEKGPVGAAVETSLNAKKWHYRLPFFAQILGPDKVHIDGSSQEVMDKEIDYAANAGLTYWAYVLYGEHDPMYYGIKNYLASSHRNKIKFSLILQVGNALDSPSIHGELDRIKSLVTERGYLTVLDQRPVIFLGFIDLNPADTAVLRGALADLGSFCQEKGQGRPYYVIMDFSPAKGKKWMDALGADAITTYETWGNANIQGGTFGELSRGTEWFWDQCKATGAPVVPIVMTGMDRRPRVEHPVPWETWQKTGDGIDKYFARPKPEEIGAQMASACKWIKVNRASAPTQLILTYAWNENDEGGWLVPTR